MSNRKLTEQELQQLVRKKARKLLEQEKEKARIHKELKQLFKENQAVSEQIKQTINVSILPRLEPLASNLTPETLPQAVKVVQNIPSAVIQATGKYQQLFADFSTRAAEVQQNPNYIKNVQTILQSMISVLKQLAA